MKRKTLSLSGLGRGLWLGFGLFALALGAVGVVLPVLPTTPFVILAAFCFGKSSPVLQKRLEDSTVFGPFIKDWRENGAIAPRYKFVAVVMMSFSLLLSFVFSVPFWGFAFQIVCIIGAAGFVLTRPNG